MHVFRIFGTALAALLGLAQAAEAQTYDCQLPTPFWRTGWLPGHSIIKLDSRAGSATVFDPIIKEQFKKPVQARLSSAKNGNPMVEWDVPDIVVTSFRSLEGMYVHKWDTTVTFHYRIELDPAKGTYKLRGQAVRLGVKKDSGTCKIR